MAFRLTIRRRTLDYVLSALILLVPAVLLHSNLKDPARLNVFDQAVLRISSPLQAAMSWIVEGVGGWWNDYVALVDVEDENDELRAANEELARENAELRRRVQDLEVIEQLAGLRRETPFETIGAHVIAAETNAYFRVTRIRIDRGGEAVAPGMLVINEEGIVGRVRQVYGSYADVELATDPLSSIEVTIGRTGGRGQLTGIGRDDSYACKIEYLEKGEEVVEGDEVLTFRLGSIPAGIPVGRITRVLTADYSRYQEVEVAPSVDFSRLRTVLVVLAPPPPPDPDAERSHVSETAYSMGPYK